MASTLYNKVYSDLGGVDFSGDPSQISPSRFAYLLNMVKSDSFGRCEGVETVEGFRSFLRFDRPIYGLHADGEGLFVHTGKRLFRVPMAKKDETPEAAREAATPLVRIPMDAQDTEDPAPMAEAPSVFFPEGDRVYLADGAHLSCVWKDRLYYADDLAYVPVLMEEGEAAEQENLLCPRGYVRYTILSSEKYRHATPNLTYRTEEDGRCYVTGIRGTPSLVSVPASVTLGGRGYTVAGIEDDAFRGKSGIKTVIIAEGVAEIGYRAFMEMPALETCVIPSSVKRLPEQAFYRCPRLATVYCRQGLLSVGYDCFRDAPMTDLHYSGTITAYMEIEGRDNLCPMSSETTSIHYESSYRVSHLSFPLGKCSRAFLLALIDGTPIDALSGVSYEVHGSEGALSLYLRLEDPLLVLGETLTVLVETLGSREFAVFHPRYLGSGADAVNGCRLAARYDGRLFYSGNPALPGLVFYTGYRESGEHDPFYVGAYSFFRDGNGTDEAVSLSSSGDSLFVFVKNKSTHAGGVFCHKAQATSDAYLPTYYPVKYSLPIDGCHTSCCYYDEVLLLSEGGLSCLTRESLTEERALSHRSTFVDARLLREDLSGAVFTRFRGYLAIAVNGKLFLMDGRAPATVADRREYEWYYLEEVGEYLGQHDCHFFRATLPGALSEARVPYADGTLPLTVKEEEGPVPEGAEILSVTIPTSEGERGVLFTVEEGCALLVDSTGEKTGGTFTPASAFASLGELLFFGTAGGGVFLFSTDKRGEDGRIPPEYYSFNGRRYRSACATKSDACGAPHLLKQTERKSAVLKATLTPGGACHIRVRTDREDWDEKDSLLAARRGYGESDFSGGSFLAGESLFYPFRDRTGPWCEKQYFFYSDDYCRPFGLSSIAYRYRIKGPLRG